MQILRTFQRSITSVNFDSSGGREQRVGVLSIRFLSQTLRANTADYKKMIERVVSTLDIEREQRKYQQGREDPRIAKL